MCVLSVCVSMLDNDNLGEYAAAIMSHLEDAHFAAMNIQGHNQSLGEVEAGLETIRVELRSTQTFLLKADILMASLKSK